MPKKIDLTGQRFGRLLVVGPAENRGNKTMWRCVCDCGNSSEYITYTNSLRQGLVKSCGCLIYETMNNLYRYNDQLDCYEIYWDTNDYVMYVDKSDFNNVNKYRWRCYKDDTGYIFAVAKINNQSIKMLRFLQLSGYDHENRNSLDFRRSNLRRATLGENARNKGIAKNNTSGVIGVSFMKKDNVWMSRIQVNYKQIYLGTYQNKDEAIKARLQAEKNYYGEFAPQKHLYEQYGIV